MSDEINRRKFLGKTTCALGGIGVVSAVYFAAASLAPSKDAMGTAIAKINIKTIKELDLIVVSYKEKPLFVMKFSQDGHLKNGAKRQKKAQTTKFSSPFLKSKRM